MSLRTFHLLFILLAIVGADLFGLWAVWTYFGTKELLTLTLGIVSFLGGLGLIVYAVRLVRMLDKAHIH